MGPDNFWFLKQPAMEAKTVDRSRQYVFVGIFAEVGADAYESVGKIREMSHHEWEEVVRGGAAFISWAEYEGCGITTAEADPTAYLHDSWEVSPEQQEKIERARDIFRGHYYRLTAGN